MVLARSLACLKHARHLILCKAWMTKYMVYASTGNVRSFNCGTIGQKWQEYGPKADVATVAESNQ